MVKPDLVRSDFSQFANGPGDGEATRLLQDWSRGDVLARDQLFELLFVEIKILAGAKLRGEPQPASFQATELVSEIYLRLMDQTRTNWRCRGHFFAMVSTTIRRILGDHAKNRLREKRGAGAVHLPLDHATLARPWQAVEFLALDQALADLAEIEETAARIVELRYFGGFSVEETAQAVGLGKATVVRRWRFAKAWLAERLIDPS